MLLLVARNDSFCQKLCHRMCNLSTNEDQHTLIFTQFNTNQRTKRRETLFTSHLWLHHKSTWKWWIWQSHGHSRPWIYKGGNSIPCNKTIDAMLMAQNYIDHMYRCFGLPDFFISDRSPQFFSQVFREMPRLLEIKTLRSTAYHPQTNRETERVNQELKIYFQVFCSNNPKMWKLLNSSWSSATIKDPLHHETDPILPHDRV